MDNFVVSARKYRPQRFEDVVGQQAIADTLKMAIKNHKLASAYLFCGPRGVGKTTCARIFAKSINCLNPSPNGEACEECDSCRSFNEQRSVNIQELNAAANNSVEDIRAIIDQVRIPPQLGKYKVIILDEVHMLSTAAGNALLKTLEEPPSYVIFILATTEKQKIMQTILSRCQIFDFNRMEIDDIVGNLRKIAANEGITAEDDALNLIAQKADGGMRDALSVFDQVSNFAQGNITRDSVMQCINALDYEYYFRMTDLLLEHNVVESMILLNDILGKGFNGGVFIGGLASHMRDLLMSRDPATQPLLSIADNFRQRYTEQAKRCSTKFLFHAIRICDRCSNEYKASYNKRLSVEIALIETAQFDEDDAAGAGHGPAKILKPIFSPATVLKTTQSPRPEEKNNRPKDESDDKSGKQSISSGKQSISQTTKQPRKIINMSGSRPLMKNAIAQAMKSDRPEEDSGTKSGKQPSSQTVNEQQAMANGQQIIDDSATQQLANLPTNDTSQLPEESPDNELIIFDDSTLDNEWQKYCRRMRERGGDAVIASRLEAMLVKCAESNIIEVSLHNEKVLKTFSPYTADIEQFMQQEFRNPNIKIRTKILPPEVVRVITNPTELLQKMRGDNPHFAKLVDELKLQIS